MFLTRQALELRSVAGLVSRLPIMDVVRGALFIGTLLVAWVSMRPFGNLANMSMEDTSTGNELPTYAAFATLAALLTIVAIRDNIPALMSLLTPAFVLLIGWLCVTILLSIDPNTSIRRFSLAICVIAMTAAMPLMANSQAEVARWFAIAALALLAICYLGIVLAPGLSIHQATDPVEPALAGNWRGSFAHKNLAAGMMALILFVGIYVWRAGAAVAGFAIVALSLLFLFNAGGKSSLGLCLFVLLISATMLIVRSFWLRAIVLLTPLLVLNLIGVGASISPALAAFAKTLPLDSSFTGRTDIWSFGVESVLQQPIKGYGFAAFWGRGGVQNLPEGKEWAVLAAHSHNGYLDTALGMGLIGLALLIAALVVKPLRDFHAADTGGNRGPLAMLMLQIWLFAIYLSSLESFFFDRADPLWFSLMMAVMFLHYLARFRAAAPHPSP